VAITLQLLTSVEDLRAAVTRFNIEVPDWPCATQLVRSVTYWVYDPTRPSTLANRFQRRKNRAALLPSRSIQDAGTRSHRKRRTLS
jgi:hypothetical protein